ncbi:MAG: hypothetical protein KIT09_35080 [Bryobacteraceae bacterium]|nr:hypothetical protein [Bryobacteraceae bacterium]
MSSIGHVTESDGYSWASPEVGASVTIDSRVVRQVRDQVLEGFHALPKRGAEVGGLLLGRVVTNDPLVVQVEDFEPIACEYRFGPSFVLSESDHVSLEEILARRGADPHLAVVGHYRSCTGRELAPDAADEKLLGRYFRDPRHLFLSIKPVAARRCVASVFALRDGRVRPENGAPQAPFGDGPPVGPRADGNGHRIAGSDRSQEHPPLADGQVCHRGVGEAPSGVNGRTVISAADATGLLRPKVALVARALASGRWREPFPVQKQRIWPWALAILAVLIGYVYFQHRREMARLARASHLGLDVKKAPGGILVSWDRSAPAFQKASYGVLSIREASGSERRVELGAEEIARGALPYQALGRDVLVRLSVYGSGPRPTTESFRIVTLAQAATTPSAAPPGDGLPQGVTQKPGPAPVKPVREGGVTPPAAAPPKAAPSEPQTARPALPAVAIHQVQPAISRGVKARIQNTIVVPVRVEINAAGRVTKVSPPPAGDSLQRYLSGRAARAAKWWRFKPARAPNGKAAASTKTLYFVFKG